MPYGLNRHQLVNKMQRMQRCEELYLEAYAPNQIATALGVSHVTVCRYIKEICERHKREDPKEWEEKRRTLVRQHCEDRRKLIVEWHRSKQTREEVTTQYRPEPCGACRGSGFDGKRWCRACGGDGEQLSEVVTRKVAGQCGNPEYLGKATACLKEIARLEGMDNKTLVNVKKLEVGKRELHLHGPDPYENATSEAILDAMEALQRAADSSADGRKAVGSSIIESKLIENKENDDGDGQS